jgi:hypothetical protein
MGCPTIDKEVVGVFVRFRALHSYQINGAVVVSSSLDGGKSNY